MWVMGEGIQVGTGREYVAELDEEKREGSSARREDGGEKTSGVVQIVGGAT